MPHPTPMTRPANIRSVISTGPLHRTEQHSRREPANQIISRRRNEALPGPATPAPAAVIDASVVLCARSHGYHAVTSDPRDLIGLDGALPVVIV